MTLINTNKVNFKNFKKESYNEKFIIFLFSFLPISLILGNSAINSNILIIDLFFLLTCYRQKQWSWIRNKYFYFFISIWIYLVINSIISENVAAGFDIIIEEIVYPENDSIIRSVGFIRFIIFLFAVQYFFFNSKKIFDQIFLYWTVIIFIVLIDVVFERIIGFNLLGFESPSSKRIVSFFKDELVVGGFILGFSFLISGFLFKLTKNDTVKKIFPSIFFCLSIICIYLSGERSNFIKALIIVSIILLLINDAYFYIKKKYIFLFIIIGLTLVTLISEDIYNSQVRSYKKITRTTWLTHSLDVFLSTPTLYEKLGHLRHFAHYEVAWQIFKDYPISGVGNLKFRHICHYKKYSNDKINYTYRRCSTHPHQVHLEILSEQGIIGYLIIIFTVFSILFNSFKIYRKTGDLIHLSSILFVLTFFIPLLPTGSFFSTFNGTIFWINFSFVHAFLSKPDQ